MAENELSEKEKLWIHFYFYGDKKGENRYNATWAASQLDKKEKNQNALNCAGYQYRQRLKSTPDFQAALEDCRMSHEEIPNLISEIANTSPADILDEHGNVDLEKLKKHRKAVKKIEFDFKGGYKVEFYDVLAATKQLAILTQMIQPTSEDGVNTVKIVIMHDETTTEITEEREEKEIE